MRFTLTFLILAIIVASCLGAAANNRQRGRNRANRNQRARGNAGQAKKATEECVDKVAHCFRASTQCQTPKLMETLKKNCAKTCGYCGGTEGGALPPAGGDAQAKKSRIECKDVSPNCVHWKANNFCESTFHDAATKRRQCAKTCNLCSISKGDRKTTDKPATTKAATQQPEGKTESGDKKTDQTTTQKPATTRRQAKSRTAKKN